MKAKDPEYLICQLFRLAEVISNHARELPFKEENRAVLEQHLTLCQMLVGLISDNRELLDEATNLLRMAGNAEIRR